MGDDELIEQLLTLEEAREILRVSPATMYRLIERESLPVVRIGRRTLVAPGQLRALIEAGGERRN